MSNRAIIITVILVVLLLLAGAIISNIRNTVIAPSPTPSSMAIPTSVPTPIATPTSQLIINLDEQSESSQSGTAILREENGKVIVSLNLAGGKFTSPQPAHIHLGTCSKLGAVKYPLTNVVAGKSETTLDIMLSDFKEQLPLAINVHKSQSQSTIYTACGDLK